MTDWNTHTLELGQAARTASRQLATLDGAARQHVLHRIAAELRQNAPKLRDANAADLDAAKSANLATPLIERLKLDDKKIRAMADGIDHIAKQVDPVGQTIEGYVRPNGLRIEKRRVPLGVILFFYESRPNVTADAAALCIKSGNAVILRGGKEAMHSNQAITSVISSALAECRISPAAVQLIESTDRALVVPLLKLNQYIDLVIPRGGESLIRAVVAESTIPVLKHYTGNCHIYIDASAIELREQVLAICRNAKTGYPGGAACNVVEKLLFHKTVAGELLPAVCADLAGGGVEIRGDQATRDLYPSAVKATEADWPAEYLSLILAVKVVATIDDAIEHINTYGSHHTDAILATDTRAIEQFVRDVDSASVMVNASTRFADGGEYGLGAELGIGTDKLHARGPMGAADLTTYKWIVTGNGHVRP